MENLSDNDENYQQIDPYVDWDGSEQSDIDERPHRSNDASLNESSESIFQSSVCSHTEDSSDYDDDETYQAIDPFVDWDDSEHSVVDEMPHQPNDASLNESRESMFESNYVSDTEDSSDSNDDSELDLTLEPNVSLFLIC